MRACERIYLVPMCNEVNSLKIERSEYTANSMFELVVLFDNCTFSDATIEG